MVNLPPTPPDSWNTIPGNFAVATTYLNHAAILLPNGRVLVAGGSGQGSKLTQIFDPNSNTWNKAADLNFAHPFDPTGTLLLNETVLLVGSSQQAEIYDSSADTWTQTANMNVLRSDHTATLLPDGRVLVAGGSGNAGTTAELFDPKAGTWTSTTNPMNAAHADHTATLLPNGKVLVAGGGTSQAGQSMVAGAGASGQAPVAGGTAIVTTSELFDPNAGTWTSIGSPMNAARANHTATLLPNGQILVAGGDTTGPTAELFDPTTGNWTSTGPMAAIRVHHTATLLSNGYVLVVGGGNSGSEIASAELYLPISNTWVSVSSMNIPRTNHTATLLFDNRVLIVGGSGSVQTFTTSDNDILRTVPDDTMLLTPDGKAISMRIASSGGTKATTSAPKTISAGQSEEYYTPSQYQGQQADLAALNGTMKQLSNTVSSLSQTLSQVQQTANAASKAQQAVRWGFINADGTIAAGSSNFTVALEPTVKIAFDITFQPPFSSTPSIVAQAIIPPTPGSIPSFLPGVLTTTVVYVDKNWCRVQVAVVDPPGQGRALPFMFIATGS